MGKNFVANGNDTIISHKAIILGSDILISWNCTFMDTDFHKIIHTGKIQTMKKEIRIQNHIWFGCNVVVLKGTFINSDCIIGANSTCCGMLDEKNCIYCGNPAKKIKDNIEWRE